MSCSSKKMTTKSEINIPRRKFAKINPDIPAIARNAQRKNGIIGESLVTDRSMRPLGLKATTRSIIPRSANMAIIK